MSEAIWHRAQQELKQPVPPEVGDVLAAVHSVTLEILESVTRPPQRLLVRAAEVEVEIDWRVPDSLPPAPAPPAPAPAVPEEKVISLPDDPQPAQHYVHAPSVGTFYRASEPGAAPFVVEGALIRAQQPVGIVEAMKLMLPVEADRPGRIVEVLVKDGGSVEFGDRLFLVEDLE